MNSEKGEGGVAKPEEGCKGEVSFMGENARIPRTHRQRRFAKECGCGVGDKAQLAWMCREKQCGTKYLRTTKE